MEFAVSIPQAAVARIHVDGASAIRDWHEGMVLYLVCGKPLDYTEECIVDAFADRWLAPTALLVVGLPTLLWAAFTILLR